MSTQVFIIFIGMTKRVLTWAILLTITAGIKIFSLFPDAVERYYSTGFYVYSSRVQRAIFGWLPFSFGDILYAVAVVGIIYSFVRIIKKIVQRKANGSFWLVVLRKLVFRGLIVYVSFNLLWGLNYNRRGIAHQLALETKEVKKEDLLPVMEELLDRVHRYDSIAKQQRSSLNYNRYLFEGAVNAYQNLGRKHDLFQYQNPSVKGSLFSYLGNYLGYTGYYNPFTGEAQVNRAVPLFIQPFTTCHEIGHQLGYAKENEANFAGYLSAKNSNDPLFLYSVYFELYSYARPYLYFQDSMALKKLDSLVSPSIKRDFKELREFYIKHENPVELVVDRLYSQYLKANEQPAGKITYSRVIVWLIAYYKKYGRQAL